MKDLKRFIDFNNIDYYKLDWKDLVLILIAGNIP